MNTPEFVAVIEQALDLPVSDRLRVIQSLAASIENQITTGADGGTPASEDIGWGKRLVELVNQLDMSGWDAIGAQESSEWVSDLRHRIEHERRLNWGETE